MYKFASIICMIFFSSVIIFRSFDIQVTVRYIGKTVCSQEMASTQGSVMVLKLSSESVTFKVNSETL